MPTLESIINKQVETVRKLINHENEPSTFNDYDDFQLLILRRLRLINNQLELWPECFLFRDKAIYYYNRPEKEFIALGAPRDLYKELAGFYEQNSSITAGYASEIEYLEDSLFDRDIKIHFMDVWFKLKKDLAKFENFYFRNLLVFQEFRKFYTKNPHLNNSRMKAIYEIIEFQSSNVETLKVRLDSVHHYYDSIKQERLNKSIYTLTVISAIFLPMNLIVGFFGMNTEGLFFKNNPNGTLTVVAILAGVTIFTLIGLKLVRVIDKYLLRFFLGRFNFYKNLTERFEKIDKHLKGS